MPTINACILAEALGYVDRSSCMYKQTTTRALYPLLPADQFISNSHIDPSLVKDVSYQPADKHNADRKKKRAKIYSCVYINILIQPTVKWLIIRSNGDKPKQRNAQFGKQVNEQWIFSKYLKKISPFMFLRKVNDVHQSSQENAINAYSDQNKTPCP